MQFISALLGASSVQLPGYTMPLAASRQAVCGYAAEIRPVINAQVSDQLANGMCNLALAPISLCHATLLAQVPACTRQESTTACLK